MRTINVPYLLSVAAPIRVDSNGVRWTDELWAKDLALHTDYIEYLTLACPRVYSNPLSSDIPLNVEPFSRIKFVELPQPRTYLDALKMLPETAMKMWRAVRSSSIVHTGFGSWPISEGLFASPMAKMQKKFLITYVESSSWRVSGPRYKWHDKLRAVVLEHLNKQCVRRANLRFFTSRAYLSDFLNFGSPHAYVAPASWIDDSTILDNEAQAADWSNKNGPVKLLFAGRLTKEKGFQFFVDAIQKRNDAQNLSISIIGEGPLRSECEALDNISLLDPVKYGPDFFNLLRQYDAIIVPSISDEQPRIIFDSFSQGIPVLGSNTGGISELITDGVEGRLFAPADANAIVDIMDWAASNRNALRAMGLTALKKSRDFTHRSMHQRRSEIITREYFDALNEHD